ALQATLSQISQKLDSMENMRKRDKKELEGKLSSLKQKKHLNKKQYEFKYKSNKMQNQLLGELDDFNEEAKELLDSGSRKRLASVLEDVSETIKKRRKILILTDRSPAGWDTVAEYLTDEWASDSDDFKKMRQAETRALSKKAKDTRKMQNQGQGTCFIRFNQQLPANQNFPLSQQCQNFGNYGISFQPRYQTPPPLATQSTQFPAPQVIAQVPASPVSIRPKIFGSQIRQPGCFICGGLDHWKYSCPARTNWSSFLPLLYCNVIPTSTIFNFLQKSLHRIIQTTKLSTKTTTATTTTTTAATNTTGFTKIPKT
uniref:CCHC-type domain-containing protein n=1 Tax=Clytia hemisphaerica TaxID=252671 RepID=A0A7M5V2X1_9CNID